MCLAKIRMLRLTPQSFRLWLYFWIGYIFFKRSLKPRFWGHPNPMRSVYSWEGLHRKATPEAREATWRRGPLCTKKGAFHRYTRSLLFLDFKPAELWGNTFLWFELPRPTALCRGSTTEMLHRLCLSWFLCWSLIMLFTDFLGSDYCQLERPFFEFASVSLA